MKVIYVYTTKGCPYCEELKKMLLEDKLSFFEVDIEEKEEQYIPIIESTGLDFVPAIEIRDNLNQQKKYLVPERDFKHLNACVQLIKENIKTAF